MKFIHFGLLIFVLAALPALAQPTPTQAKSSPEQVRLQIIDMATTPEDEADASFNRGLGFRIGQGVKTETLIKYAAAMAVLFLLFGYWVYRLRREIRHRKAAEMREHLRGNVLELLAKGAPLPRVLEAIVRAVERQNTDMLCSILLLDRQGKHLGEVVAPSLPDFFNSASEGIEIGMGVGSCGTAAFTGARVIVDDIATHPYWTRYKDLAARAGLGSCWSQPIHSSSNEVLGAFAIYHHATHAPTESDISLIEQSARLASIAIEKSIAAEKLRDNEALYRLLTEDVSDVIWKTDCDLRITYISPVDERLRGYGADEVIGHPVFEMFTEEGVAAAKKVIQQGRECGEHETPTGSVTFEAQNRCKDGRLLWAEVHAKPERDEYGSLTGYHGINREITERKKMQDQVRQLAFHDSLTKLPNRRLLNDRLSRTLSGSTRSGCYGALMFLDLDNFKPLNDEHGHEAGDLLLIEVASRLTSCLREVDTVARIGGDEFVVMLSYLTADRDESTSQAGVVAEKIRISLARPYLLTISRDGEEDVTVEHHCSASIGVVVFIDDEASQDEILKCADTAMYEAKEAGRNLIRFYDSKARMTA